MHLKKFLLFGLIAAILPAAAEEVADRKTATSLKYVTHELDTRQDKFGAEANKAMEYTNAAGTVQKRAVTSDLDNGGTDSLPMVGGVNTKLNTKQDDIDPVNDHTAVTYTGQTGSIGQKGIYQATGTYAEQSDNLIDAKTFNAALKTGLDNEFRCAETKPGTDICWVYSIHNNVGNVSPAEYTALEYIESDGTQYIDTGIVQNTLNFQVDMDVSFSDTSGRYLFGVSQTSPMYMGRNSGGHFEMNQGFTTLTSGINKRANLKWGRNTDNEHMKLTVTIDGQSESLISQSAGTTTNNNFTLFTNNLRTTVTNRLKGRIYYAKIYKNNELVFDAIPVQHGTTVGMYDTVSQQFFPSAASGTNFIAGPELNVYIPQGQ